jgi:hypothetical protein
MNIQFLLALLKTHPNSKDHSQRRIKFLYANSISELFPLIELSTNKDDLTSAFFSFFFGGTEELSRNMHPEAGVLVRKLRQLTPLS